MTWADFVVRGTLVLAAGFAASFAFGRASAALRHLIWTAAFGALLVLPVGSAAGAEGCDGGAGGGCARTRALAAEARPADTAWGTGGSGWERFGRRGSDRRMSDWLIAYLAGLLIVAGRFLAGTVRTVRMVRAGAARGVCPGAGRSIVPRACDQPSGARAGKQRCGSAHDLGNAAPGCDAARSGGRLAGCAAARRRTA